MQLIKYRRFRDGYDRKGANGKENVLKNAKDHLIEACNGNYARAFYDVSHIVMIAFQNIHKDEQLFSNYGNAYSFPCNQ